MDRMTLARTIDHTILKADATWRDVETLCAQAVAQQFAAVCINPCWVALAADRVRGSAVAVCTVVGFPLGATTPATKAAEAAEAVAHGAREVDMVANLGRLRGGDLEGVAADILAVRRVVPERLVLKVIIESALLSGEEKREAARIAVDCGADFVKTSTGMHAAGGATVADVRLIKEVVGSRARVKASGGIRDTQTALAMLEAGASRIGTSNGVAIVEGLAALNAPATQATPAAQAA